MTDYKLKFENYKQKYEMLIGGYNEWTRDKEDIFNDIMQGLEERIYTKDELNSLSGSKNKTKLNISGEDIKYAIDLSYLVEKKKNMEYRVLSREERAESIQSKKKELKEVYEQNKNFKIADKKLLENILKIYDKYREKLGKIEASLTGKNASEFLQKNKNYELDDLTISNAYEGTTSFANIQEAINFQNMIGLLIGKDIFVPAKYGGPTFDDISKLSTSNKLSEHTQTKHLFANYSRFGLYKDFLNTNNLIENESVFKESNLTNFKWPRKIRFFIFINSQEAETLFESLKSSDDNSNSDDLIEPSEDTIPMLDFPNHLIKEQQEKFKNLDNNVTDFKKFNLFYAELDIKNINYMAKALEKNNNIQEFICQSCKIDNDGFKTLLDAVKKNRNIEILSLSDNKKIDDSSVELLDDFLKENKTLKKLNLSHTGITEDGVEKIIQILNKNSTRLEISFAKNAIIGEDILDKLKNVIEKNKSKTDDTIKNNENIDPNRRWFRGPVPTSTALENNIVVESEGKQEVEINENNDPNRHWFKGPVNPEEHNEPLELSGFDVWDDINDQLDSEMRTKYLNNMRENGTYAGIPELLAFVNMYPKNIVLVCENNKGYYVYRIINSPLKNDEYIYIRHVGNNCLAVNEGYHFQAMTDNDLDYNKYQVEIKNIKNQNEDMNYLKEMPLRLTPVDCGGGGNCLFYTFAYYLEGRTNSANHMKYRNLIVDYLSKNKIPIAVFNFDGAQDKYLSENNNTKKNKIDKFKLTEEQKECFIFLKKYLNTI